MTTKTGRIRCGTCQRVLWNPTRRQPQQHDQATIHAAEAAGDSDTVVRTWAGKIQPVADRPGFVEQREGKPWRVLVCRCGARYARPTGELTRRRIEASGRGEDAYLTPADRDRD